jgi:hypothetical protein
MALAVGRRRRRAAVAELRSRAPPRVLDPEAEEHAAKECGEARGEEKPSAPGLPYRLPAYDALPMQPHHESCSGRQ